MTSSASVTNYTGYDWLGRVINSEQRVDGRAYPFTYGYLTGGQLSYEVYPSGKNVKYAYNNAGQPAAVAKEDPSTACPGGANCYASGIAYAPHGAMQSGTFGPLTQTYGYNARLQLTDLIAARSGMAKWVLHNDYGAAQNNIRGPRHVLRADSS